VGFDPLTCPRRIDSECHAHACRGHERYGRDSSCPRKRLHGTTFLFALVVNALFLQFTQAAPKVDEKPSTTGQPFHQVEPTTESLRGKVVWQAEALKRRYGIETDRDAEHDVAALEATDGDIYPLVRDARGRGFWLDPRLRDRELELYVRKYRGSPAVQIIRVYTLRPEGKYELDYWCDICAIPMYELKACECCQGATRLRERKVAPGGESGTDGDEPADSIPNDPATKTAPPT